MPKGQTASREAKLDVFGPRAIPNHSAWDAVSNWWLKHARGANTPNWDVALSCMIEGQPGMILVEAKANEPELSTAGKRRSKKESERSRENHDQIATAIAEARDSLRLQFPGIGIERDSHYQLSNRIAFAWKLASLGIPTVLIYLGFLGDEGVANVGAPFRTDAHWQEKFSSYLAGVCQEPIGEGAVNTDASSFWLLSRSLPIFEVSAKAAPR